MSSPERTITSEKGIEICSDLLFKGKKRKEIIQIITKDYKVSAGAIDKWLKKARPKAERLFKDAEAIRAREMDTALSQAVKDGLLSDIEIEMILCRIIAGGFKVEELAQEGIILRDVTPFEMINAARTIFQKRGSYAPTKIAATDSKGKDVKSFKVTLNLG